MSVHEKSSMCIHVFTVWPCQDERNQVLTLYLWIRQEWTDAYLHWDPKAYGDLDAIRIPSDLVWRPDIVLYNKYCFPSLQSCPSALDLH